MNETLNGAGGLLDAVVPHVEQISNLSGIGLVAAALFVIGLILKAKLPDPDWVPLLLGVCGLALGALLIGGSVGAVQGLVAAGFAIGFHQFKKTPLPGTKAAEGAPERIAARASAKRESSNGVALLLCVGLVLSGLTACSTGGPKPATVEGLVRVTTKLTVARVVEKNPELEGWFRVAASSLAALAPGSDYDERELMRALEAVPADRLDKELVKAAAGELVQIYRDSLADAVDPGDLLYLRGVLRGLSTGITSGLALGGSTPEG